MSTKNESTERKSFKDWFDKMAAKALAAQVSDVYPSFDETKFVRLAIRNLDELEFNGRVRRFSDALATTLPTSIPTSLNVLTRSLPPLLWVVNTSLQFLDFHDLVLFKHDLPLLVGG